MKGIHYIKPIEESTQTQSFNNIPTNTSEPLLENLENSKDTISAFIKDTEHIVERLKLPMPGFISQLKKYLKMKKKDHKNVGEMNEYVRRADVLDFQETLDNWSVDDEELRDEMIHLSDFCNTILNLIGEDQELEVVQAKKQKQAKKQQYREMKYWADEDDELALVA